MEPIARRWFGGCSDHRFQPSKSLYGRTHFDGHMQPLSRQEKARRKNARKVARKSRKANR